MGKLFQIYTPLGQNRFCCAEADPEEQMHSTKRGILWIFLLHVQLHFANDKKFFQDESKEEIIEKAFGDVLERKNIDSIKSHLGV